MEMIEDRTRIGRRNCITFKKQKDEKNFLKILNGVGCDSFIGKLKTQMSQPLNLNRLKKINCLNKATIAHELVHALGFDHEHNRPDRDDWVDIDFDNVINRVSNWDFKKIDSTQFKDLDTPYDYESIMHYHSYAHAINNSKMTLLKNVLAFL